jgi:hypothetical protein
VFVIHLSSIFHPFLLFFYGVLGMFTGRWAAGSSIRSQVSCAFHFLLSFRFFVQLVCVGRCLDTMPQKHGNGLKFTVEMLLS